MTQNLCPSCRVPYSAGDQYCIACGSALPVVEGADAPAAAAGPTIQLTKPIKTDATGAFVPVPEAAEEPAAVAATATKSKRPLIIAAAVAVVVIIGLAAGIPAIVRSAQSSSYSSGSNSDGSGGDALSDESTSDPVVDDVVESASPGTEETSAPAAPDLPPIYFSSVSGNISCEITVGGVTCQQHNIKYTKPAQACAGGPAGVVIGVEVNGGLVWPCLGGDIPGGTVVNYDVPVNYYGSNCSINLDRGITCTNDDGRGFTMEYEKGIQTY